MLKSTTDYYCGLSSRVLSINSHLFHDNLVVEYSESVVE